MRPNMCCSFMTAQAAWKRGEGSPSSTKSLGATSQQAQGNTDCQCSTSHLFTTQVDASSVSKEWHLLVTCLYTDTPGLQLCMP